MSIAALTGQKLAGTYLLNALVAHGARGVVYDARNVLTGVRCAVKIFHHEVVEAAAFARCRRDADMAAALHHPGIVRVLEWSRREALPLAYVVTEFAEGENVQGRVRRLGRLSPQQVLELGLRVGMVLQATHKLGVIHRGLSPRNLLYTQAAEGALEQGEVVRILDFGIAHLPSMPARQDGLLPYLAPEIVHGEGGDPRSDQFSLAAILYKGLSGRPPPVGGEIALEGGAGEALPPSLETLCPEAPAHLVRAIERGLSPAPADRFSSLMDFTRALDDRGLHPWRTSAASHRSSASLGRSASDRSPASRSSASSRSPIAGEGRQPSANSLSPVTVQRTPAPPPPRGGARPLWTSLLGLAVVGGGAFYLGVVVRPETVGGALIDPAPRAAAQPAPAPPPPLREPAADPLDEAEQALGRGEHARAIELARPVVPSPRAWRLIATAACRMGDARLMAEALEQLGDSDRAEVQSSCRSAPPAAPSAK